MNLTVVPAGISVSFEQLRANAVGHFQRIGAFLPGDGDVGGLAAVHPHDRGLNGGAVGGRADIADEDRRAVHDLDGDVVDLIDHVDEAVGVDVVVQIADLDVAGRDDGALRIDAPSRRRRGRCRARASVADRGIR